MYTAKRRAQEKDVESGGFVQKRSVEGVDDDEEDESAPLTK